MNKKLTSLGFAFLLSSSIFAQWSPVNKDLPALSTRGVANVNDTLFTGVRDHGIYYSVNNGDSWKSWKNNSKLPNFNFQKVSGDQVNTGNPSGTLSIVGYKLFSFYESAVGHTNIPFTGLSDQDQYLNTWIKDDGADIMCIGTPGGVFYSTKLGTASFVKSTGFPGGEGDSVNAFSKIERADKSEEDIVAGTSVGIFKSIDNGKSFTAFNHGLSTPIRVNAIDFIFTLTDKGVYTFSSKNQTYSPLITSGYYTTAFTDYVTFNAYLFGANVGSQVNLQTGAVTEMSLKGITDSVITGCTLVGNYLYVSTPTKGVFRMQINNLGVGSFNKVPEAQFSISPNPSNGQFTINTAGNIDVELLDFTGKLIKTYTVNQSADIKENLTPGIYLLRDVTNGGSKKIVIK